MNCTVCGERDLNMIDILSQKYEGGNVKQEPMCVKCFRQWVGAKAEAMEV